MPYGWANAGCISQLYRAQRLPRIHRVATPWHHDREDNLIYYGQVGIGFNTQSLKEAYGRLTAHSRESSPFRDLPDDFDTRGVHWAPRVPASVGFVAAI
jgi:hypothetical protein